MSKEILQTEVSAKKNKDAEKEPESAEILAQQLSYKIDSLLLEVEDSAMKLLSSPEISSAERDSFTAEINDLKKNILSTKKEFLEDFANLVPNFLERATELKSELDEFDASAMVSELIADKKENIAGIAGINFLLDNAEFQHADTLKQELKKQKDNHAIIDKPKFPLDDYSLKVLKAMMQEEPASWYDLKDLIEVTEATIVLMEKGISLEILRQINRDSSIDRDSFIEIINDEELIEKLVLLDQMDLKVTGSKLGLDNLEKISLDQMKLLAQNDCVVFSWEGSVDYQLRDLATCLTEENLVKLKQFDDKLSSISISEFISFTDHVLDLPEDVQKICKEAYDGGKEISEVGFNNHDLLKGLDAEKITKLKTLLQRGVIDSSDAKNLDKYLSLNDNIFDRCTSMGVDIKKAYIEDLVALNSLSDDEFSLFEKVRVIAGGSMSSDLESFEKINSQLGIADGNIFIEWIQKGDQSKNFKYFTKEGNYLEKFKELAEIIKAEPDVDLLTLTSKAYGSMKFGNSLSQYAPKEKGNVLSETATRLKESPEAIIPDILSDFDGLRNTFINFQEVQGILAQKNIDFTDKDKDTLFSNLLLKNPTAFLESNTFPLTEEQRTLITDTLINRNPIETITRYSLFEKECLQYTTNKQETLDQLFEAVIGREPLVLLNHRDFPFTPEQLNYLEVFRRIQESASRELKNLTTEIAPLIAKHKTPEEANEALEKIEQIFLTNNIPLVGKQYKVFEILYPNERLSQSVKKGKVDSLKELHNSSAQRLKIFKDLMRTHMASADSNLEQYLLVLKDGKETLADFEAGEELGDKRRESLKFFLKKINTLSGHSGRESVELSGNISDEEILREIDELGKSFGTHEGENLIQKFERTFLKRIGIKSLEEALETMKKYRDETTLRNQQGAASGNIAIEEGDLVKNISSRHLDNYLEYGVYAPEFVGAATLESKDKSASGDYTPLDTDVSMVESGKNLPELFNPGYGDLMLIIKQKEQFQKDNLDIFKIGVIAENHYGIRTGFGSTEIDAICIDNLEENDKRFDQLKFFIAKKGFYIPICKTSGEVIFTKEEYDEQKKIFSGIERFHGDDVEISDEWKSNHNAPEIKDIAQTKENIEKVTNARDAVLDKIQAMLAEEGVALHKGRYDDSLRGAVIADTGSTGRGSSLDEKFDFDFAVKLDDTEWGKVPALMQKLNGIFPEASQYENKGMMMFRSKEIEINGLEMTVDVGFNKKSDSEEFDAHNALEEKYDSIAKNTGEQAYLDTLTNIRFAKKKLKEAECYKKGGGGDGQQGGLGGIGVEYWILQNGGDAIRAFGNFKGRAFKDNQLVPFEEFKKTYKIFSAGQNIRGGVKVENFVDNMTAEGYVKMAQLAKDISS